MEGCDSKNGSDSFLDCLLFDLDDTLYSRSTGMAEFCRTNINEFLMQRFGLTVEDASKLRVDLFRTYGSSLAGLRALGYDIDADEYHSFVHGRLPYDLIKPDAELRDVLKRIKKRKLVFTNSDRVHAHKVLHRLNIGDCFEGIICFETLNPNISKSKRPDEYPVILKPSKEAMEIAIAVAKADPLRTLFFDDNVRNVAAGKSIGLQTVLVGKSTKSKEADYAIDSIHDLHAVIPQRWLADTEVNDNTEAVVASDYQSISCKPSESSVSTTTLVRA
ncbi:uncharacterized protein C24B11.05-like [Nymphaea colorata]|nr:uncharacterized protein C24B11.05-like [Nymphaea colorata]